MEDRLTKREMLQARKVYGYTRIRYLDGGYYGWRDHWYYINTSSEIRSAIDQAGDVTPSYKDEDCVNPYLLTGEELARTEAKVKSTEHT